MKLAVYDRKAGRRPAEEINSSRREVIDLPRISMAEPLGRVMVVLFPFGVEKSASGTLALQSKYARIFTALPHGFT
jgi:hypothetical protein